MSLHAGRCKEPRRPTSGWDASESNVRLQESNYNEGQSSHVPFVVHASLIMTGGQVRNTLSGREAIDMEYLLEANQSDVLITYSFRPQYSGSFKVTREELKLPEVGSLLFAF